MNIDTSRCTLNLYSSAKLFSMLGYGHASLMTLVLSHERRCKKQSVAGLFVPHQPMTKEAVRLHEFVPEKGHESRGLRPVPTM